MIRHTRTALKPRRYLLSGKFRIQHPAARAFLAPQREHVKQPMPPSKKARS
jgi:hypothetical protein